MMESVSLPRQLINRILQQSQRSPNREICGLIAAKNNSPTRCMAIANIAETPSRLFSMDPEQQIQAMRKMRESGEALYGIYHSHPHSPAIPSDLDLEQAGYPDALYLIISLSTKGVLEMRGYRLQERKAVEVQLDI